MWDMLKLLAGRRSCPWCTPPGDDLGDWITDRLPNFAVKVLLRYDALIGRVAVPLHGRLHPVPEPERGRVKDG